MGITNEIFQTEREETKQCIFNATPENQTDFDATDPVEAQADTTHFSNFMRFLAPPAPLPPTPTTQQGAKMFSKIGCDLCHTPTLMTGRDSVAALSNKPANLFSDLLVHAMGPGLADFVNQGLAGPDEFRTAPLWGVGQRLFFLHDGRATTLNDAIQAHSSTNPNCSPGQVTSPDGVACQSEANQVVAAFNKLSASDQQSIIAFLQSL